jgi:c-di-GMP-binding flagellar brake protein YcgR
MTEKRKFERFELNIQTMLNVKDEARMEKPPVLLSRDISCAGVFLVTNAPLPIGTSVDLNLLLSQHEMDSHTRDERINITTSGKVVRANDQGMAVEFDKQYKISPIRL